MHNSRATLRYARQRQQVLADEPPLVKMFLARQRRAVLAGLQAAQTRDLATAPAAAARPGIAAMLAASPAEAWQHGTAGMYDHRHAVALPWGFTPAEVGLPAPHWESRNSRWCGHGSRLVQRTGPPGSADPCCTADVASGPAQRGSITTTACPVLSRAVGQCPTEPLRVKISH